MFECHHNEPLDTLPEVPGETISNSITNGSEKSSPSEDATIKDIMISPDTDSIPSVDTNSEFPDSKSTTNKTKELMKHTESEIGKIFIETK